MDVKANEEAIKEIEKIGVVPFLQNLRRVAEGQVEYWQTVVEDLKGTIKRLEGE